MFLQWFLDLATWSRCRQVRAIADNFSGRFGTVYLLHPFLPLLVFHPSQLIRQHSEHAVSCWSPDDTVPRFGVRRRCRLCHHGPNFSKGETFSRAEYDAAILREPKLNPLLLSAAPWARHGPHQRLGWPLWGHDNAGFCWRRMGFRP